MFSALYGMLDGTVAKWGFGSEMYMISMDTLMCIFYVVLLCCDLLCANIISLLFYTTMRASSTTHSLAQPKLSHPQPRLPHPPHLPSTLPFPSLPSLPTTTTFPTPHNPPKWTSSASTTSQPPNPPQQVGHTSPTPCPPPPPPPRANARATPPARTIRARGRMLK